MPYRRPRNKPFRRPLPPPPSTDGHLYYVRLKTRAGLVYKLGFTTMASVHERFAFNGEGDEKLIDQELLFHRQADAWNLEQELHNLFEKKKLFPVGGWSYMPLYGNGQSELYCEDILGLDYSYKPEQAQKTRDNILVMSSTSTDEEVKAMREALVRRSKDNPIQELVDNCRPSKIKEELQAQTAFGWKLFGAVLLVLSLAVMLVVVLIAKLSGWLSQTPQSKKNAARIEELRRGFQDQARLNRAIKLRELQLASQAKAAGAVGNDESAWRSDVRSG